MSIKNFFLIILCVIFFCTSILAEDKLIRIYSETEDDKQYNFYGDNSDVIPYRIVLSFPELNNMEASAKLPFSDVLPAQSEKVFLMSIKRKGNRSYSYQYNYQYYQGDYLTAKHDDSYLYLFPYAHGKKYSLGQGYHGQFSHVGELTYALDFTMPIGTPVHAARNGIVAKVKEDSNVGGMGQEYAKHGNHVLIYHKDGTFSQYAHFKQNGVVVKKGDKVKAGDLLGYSGNTGLSMGPHLHFHVSTPKKDQTLQTIPVKLLNYDNKTINKFIPHHYYYSIHPGKPKFKVILGRDIKDKDYKNHKKKIKKSNTVTIRNKQIDNTYLLFIQNGYKDEMKITVKMTLNNMISSRSLPINVRVPGLTEQYLCLLRAKNLTDPGNSVYTHDYQYYLEFIPVK